MGVEIVHPPYSCTHGFMITACGLVCKKGPGESCRGLNGVCGDGLACSDCNRCEGCSYEDFKCFTDSLCVSSQDSLVVKEDASGNQATDNTAIENRESKNLIE